MTNTGLPPSVPKRCGPGVLTSVIPVLVKADEHVVSLQLLLSKLQQKSQTVREKQQLTKQSHLLCACGDGSGGLWECGLTCPCFPRGAALGGFLRRGSPLSAPPSRRTSYTLSGGAQSGGSAPGCWREGAPPKPAAEHPGDQRETES